MRIHRSWFIAWMGIRSRNVGQYIIVLDFDFRVVDVSEDLATILGYTNGELVGMLGWDLTRNDAARRDFIKETLESEGLLRTSTTLLARDGGEFGLVYTLWRLHTQYIGIGELV